jgi:hypothetical protein
MLERAGFTIEEATCDLRLSKAYADYVCTRATG